MNRESQPSDCDHPARTDMRVEAVGVSLPIGFAELRSEAQAEGQRFIERLATDWASGICRFNRDGEALFVARVNGSLAGLAG